MKKVEPLSAALMAVALVSLMTTGCKEEATPRVSMLTSTSAPAKVQATAPGRVREPAVAGLFYPKDAVALNRTIDELLASAKSNAIGQLKGLVCPHAGYPYSGLTAATAYKTVLNQNFRTVFILGPSHYAIFPGASVANADAYRTPLGLTPISDKAKSLALIPPFVAEPHCPVQRPSWWQQASKEAPATGEDTPETWEHSVEVQVPFLQKVLKNFNIVPVVLGETDPAQAAKVLAGQLDDTSLVVASSDLSHYHPYTDAQELDHRCVQAICALDLDAMRSQEACGKLPILTLMHLARQKGWKPQLLDQRNSGDTSGDKRGVVGYAAIAFYAAEKEGYPRAERKILMDLAKKSLREVVVNGQLPPANVTEIPAKLTEAKGCFVTLTKQGLLRGCIGNIQPKEPLYLAIMQNTENAAMRDPRFTPVRSEELPQLEIEISILTEPQPLAFSSPENLLTQLQSHKDGVVLRLGNRGATYLPQVWEQLPDKVEFLNSLAQKAGCEATAWRKPGTEVLIYHAEAFKENEL